MNEFIDLLRPRLRDDQLLTDPVERLVYESDGYLVEKQIPELVVFPETTDQLAEIMKLAHGLGVKVVPRGAGTSLAGGCLPDQTGATVCLSRMQRILEVNLEDRFAIVEAGVINGQLNQHLTGSGFHFAPDPSSAGASTIGGNIATNAGGPHTLKYGVTSNHVLGLEVVLPDGRVCEFGGPQGWHDDWDWAGLFTGSEGTFGFCTKATVSLVRNPQSLETRLVIFNQLDDAVQVVSRIIAEGIIPAALELMDQGMLQAVEHRYHNGLPTDAGAVLIIEVDGPACCTSDEIHRIDDICLQGNPREIRKATTAQERVALWKCRKQAFGAIGMISTSFCTQDGVVPRTRLPELLRDVMRISEDKQIRILNVFHAGDGNIHPILLFDERDENQIERMLAASEEILDRCLEYGGTVTGEHGIGIEKIDFMPKMFSSLELDLFRELRDVFNPEKITGNGKLIPDVIEAV